MLAVSAGNYGLNIALSQLLTPAEFGDAALMVTLVLLSTVVTSTLQLATSAAIVRNPHRSVALVNSMRVLSGRWSLPAAIGLAAVSFPLGSWLQLDDPRTLMIMAAGLPVHVRLAVERGRLHGLLDFRRLSGTFGAELVVRVAATLGAIALGFGVIGVTAGLNLGFVAGLAVAGVQRATRGATGDGLEIREAMTSLGRLVIAVTLVTNVDVLLSKALLEPSEAGRFAAVSLIGRGVFFASWSMQQAALPLLAANSEDRQRTIRIFVGANALLSTALVAGVWLLDAPIMRLAFGSEYVTAAGAVGPYAAGTAVLTILVSLAFVESLQGERVVTGVLLKGGLALMGLALLSPASTMVLSQQRGGIILLLAVAVWFSWNRVRLSSSSPRPLLRIGSRRLARS